MLTRLLFAVALVISATAQLQIARPDVRPIGRIPGRQQLTITLDDGQLLQIDSRTLQRLENQGVDIGTLDNLSDAELQRLGINLVPISISIPGAVRRAGGTQEIRLSNGDLLEIDQNTLRRLQNQGVDVNTIPTLTPIELSQLGISVRTDTIIIPGAIQLTGGTQQIRLRNGVLLNIDQATLRRLQSQGVNISTLPDLSAAELQQLGIQVTETVSSIPQSRIPPRIPGAITLPGGAQQITLRNGVQLVIDQSTLRRLQTQGVDLSTLPDLSAAELQQLGIQVTETVSSVPQNPRIPARIPGAITLPGGAQQITLRNGVQLVIDQATLRRLQSQGVDLSTLPDLSQEELSALGIQITETVSSVAQPQRPARIPGAVTLPGGAQQITLRNGVQLVIDQSTLRRLQVQGVDLSTLPDLSAAELQQLGIQVTETVSSVPQNPRIPARIPGAVILPGGAQQITLRNGVQLVIDQATLRRLQSQGVDLSTLPDLSPEELSALGIQITETVTTINTQTTTVRIPGAVLLPGGDQQIRLRNGVLLVIDQSTLRRLQVQGVDITKIPDLSQNELETLGIRVTETVTGTRPTVPSRTPVGQGQPVGQGGQGVVRLPGGGTQIRLRNGAILVIDDATLRRLQSQGVDINSIPNLSDDEARRLGINIREDTIVIPGAVQLDDGTQEITLSNGAVITVTQTILRRIQQQGVDVTTLTQLSEAELRRLGLNPTTFRIPGAVALPNGAQQIRLRNGVLLVIDQSTLRRLRAQGVDISTLPDLSQAELAQLGIQVTETVSSVGQPGIIQDAGIIRIPGAVTLTGGAQQIRLRNGVLVVLQQQVLRRLRVQGVDLNTLPSLSPSDLSALGIQVTETTTTTGINVNSPLRPGVTRRIIVNGQTIVVPYLTLVQLQQQGIDIDNLQSLSQQELIRLRVIPNTIAVQPRPRPQVPQDDEGSNGLGGGESGEPRPEPFNFAYTSETEDGASSSHSASQTADGVVTGSYTIRDANGQERRVDYIADAGGYRATVTTNEIGTESQNTADAVYQSSAPTAAELSRQHTATQRNNPGFRTGVLGAQPLQPLGRRQGLQPVQPLQPLQPLQPIRPNYGVQSQSRFAARLVEQPAAPAKPDAPVSSARLTAAPEREDAAPVAREPAASEAAGVQYTEDATETEAVKIAA